MALRTRLFVCDNHPIVLDGFASVFRSHDRVELVGACSWDDDPAAYIDSSMADVLVVDFAQLCEEPSAFEVIRHDFPNVNVVVFVEENDLLNAMRALDLGAAGIVAKSSPLGALEEAVLRVANGDNYLDVTMVPNIAFLAGNVPNEKRVH
mgnify:CR=1 FL=1